VELANFADYTRKLLVEPDTPEGCLLPVFFGNGREHKDYKKVIHLDERKEHVTGRKDNNHFNRDKEGHAREMDRSVSHTKDEHHFSCVKEVEKTTDGEKMKGVSKRFQVGSAETIGRRASMEDQTVIYGPLNGHDNEDYFAVFDGHGGITASKYCSEYLHKILGSILREKGSENLSMEKILKESFYRCNEALRQLNACNETGTTAVVTYSRGSQLWVANVGDSRAVLSRNGQAIRITTDHKPTLDSERKRILDLKGFVFFGRVNGVLAVSRAFGDFTFSPHVTCEPDIFGPFDVDDRANEFIIMACDGIWDVIDDSKAVQIISDSESPDEGAQKLVCAAMNARSADNISVVVLYFPHYKPKPKAYQHTSINEI